MRRETGIRRLTQAALLLAVVLGGVPAEAGRFIPSSCLECTGPVTWVVFVAQDAGDPETIAFTLRERYGGNVRAVWPDGKFAIEATTDEVRAMLADARVTLIDGRAGRYYRARGTRAAAETTSSPEAGSNVWSTGPYQYDGAGNILQIGPNQPWNQTDVFEYDRVGRLVSAQVSAANPAAQPGGAVQWSEAYAYDAFGNMLSKTTTRGIGATPETTTISVDASTNRLSGTYDPTGTSYDAGGNWRGASGITQSFDAMNRMTSRSVTGAGEEHYIYASGGERVATYWTPSQVTRYTLRGPDQKVLREFEKSATGELTWKKDYIWRGGSLLASITDDARTTHYHLDHLGTPRLLTDGSGDLVAMNAYLPFGGEIPDGELDGERHKFTGHERDNLGNGANALDYMHARYYNPSLGRFLSVDPGSDWDQSQAQSWNLYTYVRNNPMNATDPNGRNVWSTSWKVLKYLKQEGSVVARIGGASKNKVLRRMTGALDSIETASGTKRVVVAETGEARDAVARQLSQSGKMRGPERSGIYPEHVQPADGPYADVHVQTVDDMTMAGFGKGLLGIVAPFSMAADGNSDASSGEIVSAGLWDTAKAIDPLFITDVVELLTGVGAYGQGATDTPPPCPQGKVLGTSGPCD